MQEEEIENTKEIEEEEEEWKWEYSDSNIDIDFTDILDKIDSLVNVFICLM